MRRFDKSPLTVIWAVFFLLIITTTDTSAQQAQTPAALEFVEKVTLAVTPGEPAQTQLINNTAKALKVTARVVDVRREGAAPLSGRATVTPNEFELGPAEGVLITISFPADFQVDPKNNTAYVVAFGGAAETFARRAVQLKKGAKLPGGVDTMAVGAALPVLVEKWSAECEYQPWAALSGSSKNTRVELDKYLPLKPGTTAGDLEGGKVLAVLVNESGDTGSVEYTGNSDAVADGVQGVRLGFKSSGRPGTYKGKINAATESKDDDVDMSVTVSHPLIYPLVTLALGITLAFFFRQRYVGVSRPLLVLEERRAQIEDDFVKAQESFRRLHADRPYATYNIALAFRDKVAEIGREIGHLKSNSFAQLETEDLKKVEAHLDELEGDTAAWSKFPESLALLQAAQSDLVISPATRRTPTDPALDAPAVLKRAKRLLGGGDISLATFKVLSKHVPEVTELLNQWNLLNNRAFELWDSIHKPGPEGVLKEIEEEQKEHLAEVHERLMRSWDRIWHVEDYKNEAVLADLDKIAEDIRLLREYFVESPPPEDLLTPVLPALAETIEVNAVTVPEDDPAVRRDRYRKWRRFFDWALVSLSVAVALYTGLGELYFEKAFGTWQDYVKAFLWGFGAQTVLTALISGLNLLWNSRSSLRLN